MALSELFKFLFELQRVVQIGAGHTAAAAWQRVRRAGIASSKLYFAMSKVSVR
jgi:hypothetical protein